MLCGSEILGPIRLQTDCTCPFGQYWGEVDYMVGPLLIYLILTCYVLENLAIKVEKQLKGSKSRNVSTCFNMGKVKNVDKSLSLL